MDIKITNINDTKVSGVTVLTEKPESYNEKYFEWIASPLIAKFDVGDVSGGILNCKKTEPVFEDLEYHVGREMFYFVKGTAIMPFADKDASGEADLSTMQLVEIPEGTQIIIEADKLHIPPVAKEEDVQIVVVSPKMDAPRVVLKEKVKGIR